jgi:uncharacterized membrane protein YfhO
VSGEGHQEIPLDVEDRRAGLKRSVWGVVACTLTLLVCEALVFRYLFQYGVSNIAAIDGASQHFPAFLYFHEWMTAVLSGHGGNYGMWSWRLGLGADVFSTLSYYIADPFALLSLPFPAHLLEYVYEALYFFRILCAGLAAYAYLRTMKAKRFAAIAGSLVYVFSVYLFQLTIRHPYFVDPMIWFPLILIGTEQVLARRRWYLLVGALAVAAVSNFYFFYQLAIIAAVYAVARWVEITKPGDRLRKLAPEGLRVAGWYLLGVALAAWALVPLALAVFASSREASRYVLHLFYNGRTYLSYVVALVSAHRGANSLSGGFAVLGLLATGVVFLRRGNTALKIMLGALAAFAVFPALGLAANAFSFPSYRFMFVAGLFLGAAVAIVLSDPHPLSRRELVLIGIGLAVFAVVAVWACRKLGYPLLLVAVPLGIGALSWALFALQRKVSGSVATTAAAVGGGRLRRALDPAMACRVGLVALVVAGIAANGVASYDMHYNPALKSFLPLGTAFSRYRDDPGSLVSSLPLDGLQRVDKQRGVLENDWGAIQDNDQLAQGFAGLDFYYSVMADGVHEYVKGLADRSERLAFDMEGFDDRAALDTLNGVRYYLAPAEGAGYVPYGFTPVSRLGTETVYENRYTLSVGYVYHSVIASDTYAALSPLDKQQALLQSVVLADDRAPAVGRVLPTRDTVEVTYTLAPSPALSWDETSGVIAIHKKRASAIITFSPVKNAELYVEMSGITFTGKSQLSITARAAAHAKTHWTLSPIRAYYWGNRTLLVNLGYYSNGTSRAKLTFIDTGMVRYSSLKIIAVPMTRYAEEVGKLAAEKMRDVRVGADTLSGTVTSHGAGLLFLSIPYSTGWTATVDGVATPVVQANVGFSGIAVASGTHHVVLRYRTPGLNAGLAVSLLALALALALAIRRELATRRETHLAEEG